MQKSYYAIIPANVRYDNDIPANAKLLYGEITALCNQEGYCWAGNSYFADLYNRDKSTIARWIKQLEEKRYITREVIYKEGSREIKSRYMRICNDPIGKNATTPIGKNAIDNNTSLNTTSNNTLDIPYVEIINYLNDATGKKYRSSTNKTKTLIKARWNEGFGTDDFKKVIDTKTAEWMHDNKMQKFLRPDTLFGTKFEGYLNQCGKQYDDPYDNLF
ncbi:conserved phage C-terminal domain-containing protein [Virgibacillus sp. FSP13]